MIQNTFDLYDGKLDLGIETFNKKFKKLWKNYCKEVNNLRSEFVKNGANDTASKDCQIAWVKKKIDSGEMF